MRSPTPPRALAAVLLLACAGLTAAATDEAALLLAFTDTVAKCPSSEGAEWAAGTSPCGSGSAPAWRGITCTKGAVTEVRLPFCGLSGELAGELAQLPQLKTLDLSHNELSGGVPAEWTAPGAFPALENLNLAHNQLVGGLDDFNMQASGFMAATTFNVSTNGFDQSELPGAWSSPTLLLLDVSYNNVSGPLPLAWGEPKSAFPSLERLALEGNNLSGPADPWPRGSANIFGPNFLCTAEPGNPDLVMMDAAPALAAAVDEAAALLAFKEAAAGPGWDASLAATECQAKVGAAWTAGTPPCGSNTAPAWRGVSCTNGAVTEVRLPFCGLNGKLAGEVAQLPQLKTLDVSHNKLAGGVPAEWTAPGAFPALENLNLAHNQLVGGLDDFNMQASGFMAATTFNVSTNGFNQSELPGAWYSRTLLLLDVSYNNVSGPLPLAWGEPKPGHEAAYPSAFPSLERLALEGNNLSGPADPWPRGSANIFGPNFLCTAEPGNPDLVMMDAAPAPAATTDSSSSSGGLSGGAIAGIVVGAVAGAAALAVLALYVSRRRKAAADGAKGAPPAELASRSSGSDLEGGGKGGKADSVGTGSAFDSKLGPGREHGSDLSSGALLAGGGASEYSRTESGRTFGSMLVDTDARRLPADWNTVLFSELEMEMSVGAGSFGSVWRAKYCQTSVAVKMLGVDKTPGTSDTTYQRKITRQLEKEAGIMSKLRHTNICLYMGACLEPPCLLMEYCARKSVDSLLAQALKDGKAAKQLSWPRLLSMASDAAKGMVYLHTRSPPVFHRDLKSANLLVTSQWQVKVADFNLSRALEPRDFMSSLCIQNPRWLAPEVLAGQDGGLPSDVWAFGTVLWELMTWRAPFEGVNPYQIINIVQGASEGSGLALPGPDELPAGVLGEYERYVELVQACWQRDPRKRPTFEEVVARLRSILQAEMRRHASTSSPQASAQMGSNSAQTSPQPTIAPSSAPTSAQPSVVAPGAELQAGLATASGTHASFEAATQATSRAFQEVLRDSLGRDANRSPFAAAPDGPEPARL